MSVNMIKQNSVASHFNDKAKMLNLSIEEQAELLSKLYPDKIQFIVKSNLEGEKGIVIKLVDRTLDILELPECELIDFNNLFYDYYGSDFEYACNLPNI